MVDLDVEEAVVPVLRFYPGICLEVRGASVRIPVSYPRFETSIFRMRSSIANHYTTTLDATHDLNLLL
jgi:hypothetical protein